MKHVLAIMMIFIGAGVFLLMLYVEDPVLGMRVTIGSGMLLDEWQYAFRLWASVGIGAAVFAALAWYVWCQSANLDDWTRADRQRSVWCLLALVPLIAFVVSLLNTPAAEDGTTLAVTFYLINVVAVYYLTTVFCSPSSFKYTPLGSATLRRSPSKR